MQTHLLTRAAFQAAPAAKVAGGGKACRVSLQGLAPPRSLRLAARRRRPAAAPLQPPAAFLALEAAFVPPPPPPPAPVHEVSVAFVTVSPLVSAPQCLAHLSMEDLVRPAPALADEAGRPQLHSFLSARHNSIQLDAAVCLTSPVILEENAADIIRDTAEEQALGQQAQLKLRYASEVHLARQNSGDQDDSAHKGHGKGRKQGWSSGGDDGSSPASGSRLVLPPPEIQLAVQEALQSLDDSKNTLLLETPRPLPKPDASICLEEPDQGLLVSCLGSLDEGQL